MNSLQYLRVLRRNAALVAIGALLGLIVGVVFALTQPPTWRSSAQAFLGVEPNSSIDDLNQGTALTRQVIKSYASLVSSPVVLDPVIRRLDLHASADDIASRMTVGNPQDTQLLNVTVEYNDAADARRIADGIVQQLAITPSLITPDSDGESVLRIVRTQSATTPQQPASPRPLPLAVAGLAVGAFLAFVLAVFRQRVRIQRQAERESATVPAAPRRPMKTDLTPEQ